MEELRKTLCDNPCEKLPAAEIKTGIEEYRRKELFSQRLWRNVCPVCRRFRRASKKQPAALWDSRLRRDSDHIQNGFLIADADPELAGLHLGLQGFVEEGEILEP